MADLPEKTPEKDKPKKPLASRVLDGASWLISGTVGWWLLNDSARNSLYDTLKHTNKFRAERAGTQPTNSMPGTPSIADGHWQIVDKIATQGLEAAERTGQAVNIRPTLREERRRFNDVTKKFFKQLKFNNTIDYLGGIDRSEIVKAGMIGVGAAAFTLGAIRSLADSKTFQELFASKEKSTDDTISK